MDNVKLFSEFPPVTKQQWKAKAIDDLKGADFDKKLVWKTDDGFSVQPFYTAEDLDELPLHHQYTKQQRKWINYAEICVDSEVNANHTAQKLMKFGAEGFLFKIEASRQICFETLLLDIDPKKYEISFSLTNPSTALFSDFVVYVNRSGIRAEKIKGFIEYDLLERWSTTGEESKFKYLADLIWQSKPYPNVRCLTIRSHAFVNAGASTTQELAFTLNKLTDYIDDLIACGVDVKNIVDELVFHLAIGGDFFFEIAKVRAFRILLNKILNLYGVDGSSIPVICSNATWSKSFYDHNVNMLRNTSEAMSAILGGCDALLTYPHNASYEDATDFSRRIALNVSNILKEESYFNKVADPAAGSYYIENLTSQLVENTLTLFKEIENAGGYVSAFRHGLIQEKIRQVRAKKEAELGSRRRVYVGVNKYPDLKERTTIPAKKATDVSSKPLELLVPQRAPKAFEEMKNRTLTHFKETGERPAVYLVCFGSLAMRKARATFAADFFATAAFEIMGELFFDDIEEGAKETAESRADIVVMCSSDEEYAAKAVEFAKTFKSYAANKVLVLAGYPEAIIEELKNAGVDEFIHIKSNVVEVLTALQNKLLA